MTLLDVLQKINKESMDAAQLTDMAVGTVTSASPLEVTMDVHQAALKEEVLILTDAVRGGYFTDVNGELCVIWGQTGSVGGSLAVGDKVLMLSVKHGQQFIVLSRL